MVDEQVRWRTEDPTTVVEIRELWLDAQSRLLALLKGIHSLKTRSKSLEGRLNNEIGLVGTGLRLQLPFVPAIVCMCSLWMCS
jgi:hypothetical protein